jgi:hypothetical protein
MTQCVRSSPPSLGEDVFSQHCTSCYIGRLGISHSHSTHARVQVGAAAYVNRTVTVRGLCPPGEVLCSDDITCSDGGVCAEDLGSLSNKIEEEELAEPDVPTVVLKTNSVVPGEFIQVRVTDHTAAAMQVPAVHMKRREKRKRTHGVEFKVHETFSSHETFNRKMLLRDV